MPTKLEVGERIKDARFKAGLTQAQLGDAIGVSRQAICNYETGDASPSDELKIKIAEVLNVNLVETFFAPSL